MQQVEVEPFKHDKLIVNVDISEYEDIKVHVYLKCKMIKYQVIR